MDAIGRQRTVLPSPSRNTAWQRQKRSVGMVLTASSLVGIVSTVHSADLIRELKKAGWYEDRVVGSHHILKHAGRPGHLTVPHPKKDLGKGLVHKIRKQAGLE